MPYEKHFQIDRIKYRFVVNSDFSLVFEVTGGFTRGGEPVIRIDDFGDEISPQAALGDCHAPFRVLSKVAEITLGYTSERKPAYLIVKSYGNKRRAEIYAKLARRYLHRIKGYEISFFNPESADGYLLICKTT